MKKIIVAVLFGILLIGLSGATFAWPDASARNILSVTVKIQPTYTGFDKYVWMTRIETEASVIGRGR